MTQALRGLIRLPPGHPVPPRRPGGGQSNILEVGDAEPSIWHLSRPAKVPSNPPSVCDSRHLERDHVATAADVEVVHATGASVVPPTRSQWHIHDLGQVMRDRVGGSVLTGCVSCHVRIMSRRCICAPSVSSQSEAEPPMPQRVGNRGWSRSTLGLLPAQAMQRDTGAGPLQPVRGHRALSATGANLLP